MRKQAKAKKSAAPKPAAAKAAKPRKPLPRLKPGETRLLSGGNPQIAKGFGNAPVQAYIAAMPGWKREMGRRIDAIITRAVPKVQKAVKWNSPMYGMEENHYFLGIHVFEKYVKVAFFMGSHLKPMPPDTSKQKNVRYLNVKDGELDEAQFADWVKQASKLPGEKM